MDYQIKVLPMVLSAFDQLEKPSFTKALHNSCLCVVDGRGACMSFALDQTSQKTLLLVAFWLV